MSLQRNSSIIFKQSLNNITKPKEAHLYKNLKIKSLFKLLKDQAKKLNLLILFIIMTQVR